MYAHTAADALSVVGRFRHIHIHLAGFGAFSTGDALVFIHLNLEEGHPVEQRIECTQWAEPLAEGTIEYHAQHDQGFANMRGAEWLHKILKKIRSRQNSTKCVIIKEIGRASCRERV